MDQPNTYETAARRLRKKRDALISDFSDGKATDFMRLHTRIIDEYFLESFEKSMVGPRLKINQNPFAIIALGGYGRMEQCVGSDVDILFLFQKKVPPQADELIREILYPLWDAGLEVGHAVRSLKDCISLASGDVEVLTSLLDARFLCGMSPLCTLLSEKIQKKILSRGAKKAATELIQTSRARHHVCGDASYLLEPDLKEGQGGLRDYHSLLWLARIKAGVEKPKDLEYNGLLSHEEYNKLKDALTFIWKVRSHLHIVSKRKCDRLHFEHQKKIAEKFGFEDRGGHKGVELFLGELQGRMEVIKQQHCMFIYELENSFQPKRKRNLANIPRSSGLELKRGLLAFSSPKRIPDDPHLLIRIFEQSARSRIPLSSEAKRVVNDFRLLIDEDFRISESALRSFENILAARTPDFDVLDEMLHSGFLLQFLPEFSSVINRIEYDAYHHYPVDKHLLLTVRNIKEFGTEGDYADDGRFHQLYDEISDPRLLLWAALLHDIGKCDPQKDHSELGAEMASEILIKRGFGKEEIETVAFLVKEHLLLSKTAARRDIEDENTAICLAREIGDVNRLKMLYILTLADLVSTGKGACNDWSISLLWDLFLKVLRTLERGELATREAAADLESKKETVLQAASGNERAAFESIFQDLSPRYLLYNSAGSIINHIRLFRRLAGKNVVWEISKDPNTDTRTVTICAEDAPGLFSRLAGVFSLHNLDILEAQAYTWRNGAALDIFKVRPPLDKLFEDEKWASAEKDLKSAISGKLDLGEALEAKLACRSNPMNPAEHSPEVTVKIDNESSGFFTIIEVHAPDGPGLLFKLTDAIFRALKLDIWIAKVATRGDRVIDVFYVRDVYGQKIRDDGQTAMLQKELEQLLKASKNARLCVA